MYQRSFTNPDCLFRSRQPYDPVAPGASRALPLSLLLLSQRFAFTKGDDPKVGEALVNLTFRLIKQECAERTGLHERERAAAAKQ
jgi:hypothetical protein